MYIHSDRSMSLCNRSAVLRLYAEFCEQNTRATPQILIALLIRIARRARTSAVTDDQDHREQQNGN